MQKGNCITLHCFAENFPDEESHEMNRVKIVLRNINPIPNSDRNVILVCRTWNAFYGSVMFRLHHQTHFEVFSCNQSLLYRRLTQFLCLSFIKKKKTEHIQKFIFVAKALSSVPLLWTYFLFVDGARRPLSCWLKTGEASAWTENCCDILNVVIK